MSRTSMVYDPYIHEHMLLIIIILILHIPVRYAIENNFHNTHNFPTFHRNLMPNLVANINHDHFKYVHILYMYCTLIVL